MDATVLQFLCDMIMPTSLLGRGRSSLVSFDNTILSSVFLDAPVQTSLLNGERVNRVFFDITVKGSQFEITTIQHVFFVCVCGSVCVCVKVPLIFFEITMQSSLL